MTCAPATPPRRLLLVALALATVLVAAGHVLYAVPRVLRQISLTATPNPLALGTVSQPGTYDCPTALNAHFAANCNHGNVVISTAGLQSAGGHAIPPARILVKLPDTGEYVPMTAPVAVSAASGPGIRDLVLRFRVETLPGDPAGTYTGTFQTLTFGGGDWPNVPGPTISVSLELEIYCGYELQGGKCYVHLGQPFQVADEVLTLRPTGTFTANAGMYVGLNLTGVGLPGQEPIERDTHGRPTGRIYGAMVGTKDVLGRSIAGEAFDVLVRVSWNGGTTYNPPDYFGVSPDGSVSRTLWWLAGGGVAGQYNWAWEIRLLPETAQADGNYDFRPELVVAPQL